MTGGTRLNSTHTDISSVKSKKLTQSTCISIWCKNGNNTEQTTASVRLMEIGQIDIYATMKERKRTFGTHGEGRIMMMDYFLIYKNLWMYILFMYCEVETLISIV